MPPLLWARLDDIHEAHKWRGYEYFTPEDIHGVNSLEVQ